MDQQIKSKWEIRLILTFAYALIDCLFEIRFFNLMELSIQHFFICKLYTMKWIQSPLLPRIAWKNIWIIHSTKHVLHSDNQNITTQWL